MTIHNMVSHDYFDEDSSGDRIPEIIRRRLNSSIQPTMDPTLKRKLFSGASRTEMFDYLLMVSTIEPRKNHLALLTAWERIRLAGFPGLKLIVVGSPGWHHEPIVQRFRPWTERGELFLLEDVAASELRALYKHARATVCPSLGEGFDFSGVEAMKSGGAVVASNIEVHREIYGDAAVYFNPYCAEDLARAILTVIEERHSTHRESLVVRGAVVANRYSHQSLIASWQSFLASGLR